MSQKQLASFAATRLFVWMHSKVRVGSGMGGWDKNLKRAVGISKDQKDQIDVCHISTAIYWWRVIEHSPSPLLKAYK